MANPRKVTGTYEVGKGRPPKGSRWRPGQSGNPSGRPKGSKSSATLAREELSRSVTAMVSGKPQRMSVARIACRRLGEKAMTGDYKALGFLLALADNVDRVAAATKPTTEKDLAIIADFLAQLNDEPRNDKQEKELI